MTHNDFDHGTPTEVLFYLLSAEGDRRYFDDMDTAIEAYRPGDAVMVIHDDSEFIRAGRAT